MQSDHSQRPTLADVARKAGVSGKSVSRVVNGEAYVSAELKAKVDAAIAELGYVPDLAARSLAGARSFTISLLLDTNGQDYVIQLLEGAYEACKLNSYHLRIENLDATASNESLLERLDEVMRHSRLDGFILAPPFSDNTAIMDWLEERQVRFTRVAPCIERERSPCVFVDDAAAAGEIAQYLVSKGHRRIGLVNGSPRHGAAIARRTGFLDKIAEIAPDAELVEATGNFRFEDGIDAGKALLGAGNPPTAIFAANDRSAAGVMNACAQLGISVPDDVSLCGFDDSWLAKLVWPYLTTVRQPVSDLGREAARLLIEKDTGEGAPKQIMLGHSLIERDSVRSLDQ
tara:strand:- start:20115 stop:21146 length:1032 start_codon:yes stop_codon:yes gene_type:complete